MQSFLESLDVRDLRNANFYAADLFRESFAAAFPVPRENCGLPIPTPVENWHQYVAFYKWSETHIEPVGFCNWIRFDEVYLEGGMCVRRNFYRRLSREHWLECKALGGVAQLMMQAAERQLNDCDAWFGYCGDKKAFLVDVRAGYVQTPMKYIIAKWFRDISSERQRQLIGKVGLIGPF